VFPKIFLLHKVVRDAKKVEKHWITQITKLNSFFHEMKFRQAQFESIPCNMYHYCVNHVLCSFNILKPLGGAPEQCSWKQWR